MLPAEFGATTRAPFNHQIRLSSSIDTHFSFLYHPHLLASFGQPSCTSTPISLPNYLLLNSSPKNAYKQATINHHAANIRVRCTKSALCKKKTFCKGPRSYLHIASGFPDNRERKKKKSSIKPYRYLVQCYIQVSVRLLEIFVPIMNWFGPHPKYWTSMEWGLVHEQENQKPSERSNKDR